MTTQVRCHSSPAALFTVQLGDDTRPNPEPPVFPIFIAGVKMKSQSQQKDSRRQKEINMQHSHAPRDMQTLRCFDFRTDKKELPLPSYRLSLALRDKNRQYSSYKANFCPQAVLSPNWKAFLKSPDGISCKQQQQWSINPVKPSGRYRYHYI